MDLRKRLVQLGKKITPSNKMSYTAPPEKNQSVLTDAMLRKMRNPSRTPSYKIPKTPKDSGLGWGP